MKNDKHRLAAAMAATVAIALAAATLAGSAAADMPNDASAPSPADVSTRCLARVANAPSATPGTLNARQWARYVGCELAGNLHADRRELADNPEATVSIRLNPDGTVASISAGPSGNPAWDAAVQRSIAAVSPLPSAPTPSPARIDMRFRPTRTATGIGGIGGGNGLGGLGGASHWSVHQCTTFGGARACN
ncbi:energy transducer TonB [Burkholderia guangdongensis]|uniref:energy transducer TonB n=1 Tax=Burkholderia guangdongensis TaxID=1792500 RepID=UPI0015CD89EB|nr:energy transducer TonB [Burkholderia guangdongensis]